MFSKSKPTPGSGSAPSLPPAQAPARMATGAHHTTFSILGSDVVVTGNIAASVDLHIDGKIEGDLKCANLVQGEGSEIKGAEIGRAQVELQSLMRISYAVFCLKKQ